MPKIDALLRLEKKYKYLLMSGLVTLSLFLFAYVSEANRFTVSAFILLATFIGTLAVQYSGLERDRVELFAIVKSTFLGVTILPLVLVCGAILSLVYFPNLGLPTKIITLSSVGALMYATLLVNNIFLVVRMRGETIPLYRAAFTWSQILLAVVAIPFFAGVFKLPYNAYFQSIIVAIVSVFLTWFIIWAQEMDSGISAINRGEKLVNGLFIGFGVFALSVCVSFVPSESFLRSLLISSLLMFLLGYMQAHYRNVVTKRLVIEYLVIISIFLLLMFVFN